MRRYESLEISDNDIERILRMRLGDLVEMEKTAQIFTNPKEQKTEDYITGRFG